MAENKNKDTIIGFILGALFELFAVIGYAIAGDNKKILKAYDTKGKERGN